MGKLSKTIKIMRTNNSESGTNKEATPPNESKLIK